MKTIIAEKWMPGDLAYLWEETGNGSLRIVTYVGHDWWIRTGGTCGASWCCCPDTTLYVFDTHDEFERINREMQRQLANRRETWHKEDQACTTRNWNHFYS